MEGTSEILGNTGKLFLSNHPIMVIINYSVHHHPHRDNKNYIINDLLFKCFLNSSNRESSLGALSDLICINTTIPCSKQYYQSHFI